MAMCRVFWWGLVWLSAGSLAAWAQEATWKRPVTEIAPERFAVDVGGHRLQMPYIASRPLDAGSAEITRLVMVQHGARRDAVSYFQSMVAAAQVANATASTLIVCPQYLEEQDLDPNQLSGDILYFGSGWRGGDKSRNEPTHPRPARISNFDVLDQMILKCCENYPNLRQVVVAGHSAGGQAVQRYSVANQLEPVLRDRFGVGLRYLVMNPSSYLYLTDRRLDGTQKSLRLPTALERVDAPDYNQFKYGLDGLNEYFLRNERTEMVARFPHREVIYLIGEDDNDPAHESLDKSAAAMLQGDSRFSRAVNHYRSLGLLFGPEVYRQQRIAVMPGVAHNAGAAFTSPAALHYLFGVEPRQDGPLSKYHLSNVD